MGCGMSTHNGFEADDGAPRPASTDQQAGSDVEHNKRDQGETIGAAAVLGAATALATGEPASLNGGKARLLSEDEEDKASLKKSEADETSRGAATDAAKAEQPEWRRFSSSSSAAAAPQLELPDLVTGTPLIATEEENEDTLGGQEDEEEDEGGAATEAALTMSSTTTAATTATAVSTTATKLPLPELLPSIDLDFGPIELDSSPLALGKA
ncbi:hypothetical protein JDV02_009159 [Purpureocillium takamizusanense]|uniref:Uncharacterized protein n=1 Tax=Purpureocillium takamizusanense TaxID=2060973 RepID=A0A9Q8VDZ3_9HYPO|nr:uncharacterized protein JDV02_009159 [Purpureocillium takamizusanense]UNI23330.1 hypothetical protein JDV02_009159 [Purpureocillium takamizusanense]